MAGDDILIRFSVRDDGSPVIERVNEKLKDTGKQSKALVPGLDSARKSLSSFAVDNAALIGILVGVGLALKSAVDDTVKYANEVRQLSMLSGESAENSSRFIQVLDDYKLSADDALLATKALTKNGLAPNIETLAQLSDQYLALNGSQEKNEFILKNLGRGGLQWVEVLQKGSKAILEQGAAVDKSLILSQKSVDAAREYEIALDDWNDAVQGVKISIGNGLLPPLTKLMNNMQISQRTAEILTEKYGFWSVATQEQQKAARDQAEAELNAAHAAMLLSKETDGATQSTVDAEAAAKALKEAEDKLSDTLNARVSLIGSLQGAEDDFNKKMSDLTQERVDLEQKIQDAKARGYEKTTGEIAGYMTQLDEVKQKEADAQAERDKQTLQFISNMLLQNLAMDGFTQAEFDAFAKQQEAWGLWSADTVAKAKAAWEEADKITASIHNIPEKKTVDVDIWENHYQRWEGPQPTTPPMHGHASGGSFTIPYTFGNEGFVMPTGDTASGGETITVGKNKESRTEELLQQLINKKTIDEGKLARIMINAIQASGG